MTIKEILRRFKEAKIQALRLGTLDYIGLMKIQGSSHYPYTLGDKIRFLAYL